MKLNSLPPHVADPDPSIYMGDNYVVLDFETTTEYKGSPLCEGNRIVMASWYDGRTRQLKSCFGSEFQQGELVAAIASARFIVAHNAKFELGWIKRCGVDLRKIVCFDTMIADHVLGGNRYFMQMLGLDMCLQRRHLPTKEDTVKHMIKGGCLVEDIPASWLQKYCERDVLSTHELFLQQRQELQEGNKLHLQYQRCLLTPVLADIEFNGITIDAEQVAAHVDGIEDEYARTTSDLQEFCEGALPTSHTQLSNFVYNTLGFKIPRDYKGTPFKTAAGNGSVCADAMKLLRPTNKRQREFLERYKTWKNLDTAVTKYLRKFVQCCDENGGHLLGVFNQCAARTHRLSSSGLVYKIQFQNLDRDYKKFFKAREDGWLVGEIDGSQLEFRTAVHMGRDPVGLKNIRTKGFDIHRLTADTLEVSRQDAKPFTFKPLYGGSGGTDKQRAYFEKFKSIYSQVASTQRGWVLKCLQDKKFTTEYGLTFYFPTATLKPSGWITNTTNIYNYPIQGFATAEIIPLSLVCCWHRMKDWKSFIVNTVHDSVVAELHPDEVEAWHDLARQSFIDDTYALLRRLYSIDLTVPLGAGVVVGRNWNQGEEFSYDAPDELYIEAARQEGMI
jgi:DNA polymerase I-like protein with 3'-5' exonuclease and polymerase domains